MTCLDLVQCVVCVMYTQSNKLPGFYTEIALTSWISFIWVDLTERFRRCIIIVW